jgi:PTS system mannose-specific IIA component
MSKKDVKPPTGLLLVAHLDVAECLLRAAQFIMGPQEGCQAVGVESTSDVPGMVERIRKARTEVDLGAGVLVLTDMFGGTPTNLALSLLGDNLEVLTGLNLPMVLKALQCRHLSPSELAHEVCRAGQEGIVAAGEVLGARKK